MELKINAVAIPEAITFNYEELKTELIQKASVYESLVYTEDQVKAAKADRANLNRLKKALNDERIKREKEYMQPFTTFKAQIAEIISIIDKPCAVIDKQVKAFEDQQKEDKQKAIMAFYAETITNHASLVDAGIKFELIQDQKWLNASVSLKSIKEAIEAKVEQIEKDLVVIENLPSYAFEAKQMYLSTLDLAKAVSEAHRLQEMAEKKAAYEAERAKAEELARNAVRNIAESRGIDPNKPLDLPTEPLREWVRFQALMTVEEAKALGQYMRSHGIQYKSV